MSQPLTERAAVGRLRAWRADPRLRGWVRSTFFVACLWAPALLTFSWVGREGPLSVAALDLIAVVKGGARVVALLSAVLAIATFATPRSARHVAHAFLPFALFAAWAGLSVSWSPLTTVSLGQWIGLLTLLLTAVGVALLSEETEAFASICLQLAAMLLAASTLVLAVHAVAPQASGMLETRVGSSPGLIHPTAAAATASLGLLLGVAAASSTPWIWARWLLLPVVLVQGTAIYVAQRRAALFLVALLVPLLLWIRASRRLRLIVVTFTLLAAVGYWGSDPQLERAAAASRGVAQYLRRNDSPESLLSLNGRLPLWRTIGREVARAPAIGHGYFVTSQAGRIEIWTRHENLTAHNVFLQVLVSTGAIGLLLFLWGLLRPITIAARGVSDPGLRIVLGVPLCWYLGWGMVTDSFMGPVRAESVVFFALLGAAVALAHGSSRSGSGEPR